MVTGLILEIGAALYITALFVSKYQLWLSRGKTFLPKPLPTLRPVPIPTTSAAALRADSGVITLTIPVTSEMGDDDWQHIDIAQYPHLKIRELRDEAIEKGMKGARRWKKAKLIKRLGYE